jgi:exopolysaccharide/PEP-CTERM locus tyrosine autokinase
MTLIEQAAKRLEELRRAGAATADDASVTHPADNRDAQQERLPTPEAVVRGLEARAPAAKPAPHAPVVTMPPADVAVPRREPAPSGQVRRVDIDLESLKRRGFVTPDAPKSQIAEEFRVVKRPIIRNAHGASGTRLAKGNLVMVTSALPREGKTFTAVNLAMSVAMEVNTTVLLVDGDVAHPDLPNLLGVPAAPGLLDVLTQDGIDIGDVLVRTNIDNLMVLPTGTQHRRATEVLASEQMAKILRELASRYSDRIIIFDSPPLLATTEARVLATQMGQIVMVVAADSTRQQTVNLALSTIESCDTVLMMLNKASQTDVGAYYGYYAGDDAR